MFVYVGEKLGLGYEEYVKILVGSSNYVVCVDVWFGFCLIDLFLVLMVGLMRVLMLMIYIFDFVFFYVNFWLVVFL